MNTKQKNLWGMIGTVFFTILSALWMYPIIMVVMNSLKVERAITTNGAFTPQEAVAIASKILIDHLDLFAQIEKTKKGVQQVSTHPYIFVELRKHERAIGKTATNSIAVFNLALKDFFA